MSLYSVAPIAERWGKAAAFPATALLFFVFALPCFVFVRERRPAGPARRRGLAADGRSRASGGRSAGSARCPGPGALPVRALPLHRRGQYRDPLHGRLRDGRRRVHQRARSRPLLALSTLFAIAGALGSGTPHRSLPAPSRRCSRRSGCWVAALLPTVGATGKRVLWIVGPLVGAGARRRLWAADRVLMFRLSPPEELGEFYGVYGMVGRFSAITGPLVWGAIVYALDGYRRARIPRRDRLAARDARIRHDRAARRAGPGPRDVDTKKMASI